MHNLARVGSFLMTFAVLGAAATVAAESSSQATGQSADTPLPAASQLDAEAGVTLGEDVVGEIFIRNVDGDLVAQMLKRSGRRVVVPLEPGKYDVECVTEPQRLHAAVSLGNGEQIVLDRDKLQPEPRRRALHWLRRRHEHERPGPSRPTYDVRTCRFTMDMGGWTDGHGRTSVVITDDGIESRNGGFLGGLSFGYRVTPEWMVTLGVTSRLIAAHDGDWREANAVDHASFLTTLAVGARYYLPPMAAQSGVKPYVAAGIGPTFGTEVDSRYWYDAGGDHHRNRNTVRSEAVFGGYVGAGIDLHPTRWLVLGTDVSYHVSPKLSDAVDGRRDTKGFAFAFQIGTSFGRRLPARDRQ